MSPWATVALGIGMGVASGMGVGGGKLLIPILVAYFGVAQPSAQGVALVAFIPIAAIAGWMHLRSGVVDPRRLLPLIAGSVAGAALGVLAATATDPDRLQRWYGWVLFAFGLYEMSSREGTGRAVGGEAGG